MVMSVAKKIWSRQAGGKWRLKVEAKDTVLSDKETIEIIKQYRVVKLGQILPYHWHRETQAKITWSIAK